MTNEDGRESSGASVYSKTDEGEGSSEEINFAMKCVLKSNAPRFIQCFEDEEDPYKDTITELMSERSDNGKTPLDMAAILERIEMIKELLTRGVEVNTTTSTGRKFVLHTMTFGIDLDLDVLPTFKLFKNVYI